MPRSPRPLYTWVFSANIAVTGPTDDLMRAEMLYQLGIRLTGGGVWTDSEGAAASGPTGWAVDSSCSSFTAGVAGDGVDYWTGQTRVVWATSGTAHAWKVLVHADFFGPSQPLYVLLDCSEAAASTANGTLGIFLAEDPFTGGTLTNRPTSISEAEVLPQDGTVATNASGWQGFDGATTTAKIFHISMTTDATKWRVKICDGGVTEAVWDFFRVEDAPTGWSRPVLMAVMSEDTQSETHTWPNAWNQAVWGGRYHGFDTTLGAFTAIAEMPGSGTGEVPHTDEPGNSFDGGIMPAPIPLIAQGTVTGHIAVIPDCWWGSNVNGTGDHAEDDLGNLRQFAQFGDFVYPWNRSTALVA